MANARTVLWFFAFFGFAVNYMIRINLNITIVQMVAAKNGRVLINASTERTLDAAVMNSSSVDLIRHVGTSTNKSINYSQVPYEAVGFHWNEYQQGLVLGSFYWAHWITQIPGGYLAKKYGTKLIFGLANAIGCWMCFLIPYFSYWDYRALMWLRVMQGLITGLAWPAMHVLTARWIPPNERSKFLTAYLGSSVGIAVFYPLFGFVMHRCSWEFVFHICGFIGTLWWFGWVIFIFDNPAAHPRISEEELLYIKKSLGTSVQQSTTKTATPWRAILSSRPVWMNIIAQWGGIWGLFTLMTQAPTYFKVVHNWNIQAIGLLSGLPHLMRMIFAYAFSVFADYLLSADKISRTNLRKLATAVCCILKGLVVLALAYFGHNSIAAIVLVTLATMFHGAVSSGPLAAIIDIAPNYAGIVLGMSGMIGVLPGFISPYIVGILTYGHSPFTAWRYVFLICAGMLIVSGVLYVIFNDSTIQSWNSNATGEDAEYRLQMLPQNEKELPENCTLEPLNNIVTKESVNK